MIVKAACPAATTALVDGVPSPSLQPERAVLPEPTARRPARRRGLRGRPHRRSAGHRRRGAGAPVARGGAPRGGVACSRPAARRCGGHAAAGPRAVDRRPLAAIGTVRSPAEAALPGCTRRLRSTAMDAPTASRRLARSPTRGRPAGGYSSARRGVLLASSRLPVDDVVRRQERPSSTPAGGVRRATGWRTTHASAARRTIDDGDRRSHPLRGSRVAAHSRRHLSARRHHRASARCGGAARGPRDDAEPVAATSPAGGRCGEGRRRAAAGRPTVRTSTAGRPACAVLGGRSISPYSWPVRRPASPFDGADHRGTSAHPGRGLDDEARPSRCRPAEASGSTGTILRRYRGAWCCSRPHRSTARSGQVCGRRRRRRAVWVVDAPRSPTSASRRPRRRSTRTGLHGHRRSA